ncbi:MAG: phosphopantetheine-binding protein, partial [Cyanobacteria bacterium P01_G01_bin.67]
IATNQLREFLRSQLPEYMLPNIFVTLDNLPLTPNGKVDRKALPAPESRPELEEAYVMPKTEAERTIATVWQDLLQLEKVGINDNFFSLGGNSLLLVSIQAKLSRIFGMKLSIIELFKYPIIKELAQYITHKTDVEEAEENSSIRIYDRASKQKKFIKRREQILRQQRRKVNG